MNKRMRKKKHVNEFAEFGRQLVIQRNRQDGFDEFLDSFVELLNQMDASVAVVAKTTNWTSLWNLAVARTTRIVDSAGL